MRKNSIFAMLLMVVIICSLVVMTPLATALAESTDEYIPQLAEFKSDNFESYTINQGADSKEVMDTVWNNSPLLFVQTGDFYTLSGEGAIAGNNSLVWDSQPLDSNGWTGSNLGVAHSRLSGTEGGLLLKISFKVRLVGMNRLVVHAREVNAASGDGVLQNMAIDGNYNALGIEEDLVMDDPETKVTSEYVQEGDYALVEFTLRGSDVYPTYFCFDSQIDTDASQSYVVFDDIKIYREVKPSVDYIPYRNFVTEGFETSLEDSLFNPANENGGKNININEEKSTVINDGAIKDAQSLDLYATSRGQEVLFNSSTIKLEANNYKLYFLNKSSGTAMFGIRVINAANDEVVYSYTYSITENKRLEGAKVTLFDASQCNTDSRGVRTCFGEFKVSSEMDVYLQIVFKVSNKDTGHILFDDICLLESYNYEAPATEMPPSTAVKITGTQAAKYEEIVKNNTIDMAMNIVGIGAGVGCCSVVIGSAASKKRKKYLSLILAVMLVAVSLLSVACQPTNEQAVPTGYQVVAPERISGKLDNPGTGWVVLEEPTYGGHIDIGSSGDLPEASLAALSTTWFHIETREDYYDWTMCDQAVDYWTSTGRRVLLRISTDSCVWPYTYNATPSYLFEKYNVGYEWVPYTDSGPVTTARVTNLSDPVYQERLDKFLNALYEHYNDNPMVDTVEIRGFGMWGEWHHGYTYDSTEERVETLGQIIDKYYNAFDKSGKTLAVSCSWDPDYINTGAYSAGYTPEEAYQNYVQWSAFDKAWRTEGITFRRDGGANALRYDYDERLMAEAFRSGKRLPILGEYANNYYSINAPGSAYTLESALDDVLYKIRPNNITTLGWVAVEMAYIIAQGDTDFIDRGNTMMGYRLAVDEAVFPEAVSAGGTLDIRTTWSNSAVGIFPYDYPVQYKLLDGNGKEVYTYTDNNFDARTFVQGEINNVYSQFEIPKNLATGKYSLAVCIPNVNKGETEHDFIALGMAGETSTNSRIYKLGDIEVKSNAKTPQKFVTQTTWDKISQVKLDANSTYEVTFRYQPHFDMANFFFGNNDGYHFYTESSAGKSNHYMWQDISGEVGQKTVTIHTGDEKDTRICIESINFDAIGVDEVWIEKKSGYFTDFTGYDYNDTSTLVMPMRMGTASVAQDGIDGDSLVVNSSNSKEKHLLAKTDYNNVPLKKGMRYTVTFDFRAEADVADGGYYFLALGNGDSFDASLQENMTVIGEWYERADNWDTRKTFSFICTEDNQAIIFGINMPGSYLVDNLTINATQVSQINQGQDLGFEHNEIPVYDDIGLGNVETFDKGTFQASGFNWGQFAYGRMTFDPNELVGVTEGSASYMNKEVGTQSHASLLGRAEVEAYNPEIDNVWFEFARTKLEYYNFKPNAYYTVELDFRILKQFESGYVFCFFRDDTLPDRFDHVVQAPVGGVQEDVYLTHDNSNGTLVTRNTYQDYHFKQTFQMGDFANYQFMICMYGMWEIAVDNIYIYEVSAPIN